MENKILFVDDEANILDTFRRNLSRKFAVDTALGPKEALGKIMAGEKFAVVVSDLKMPGMTGIELLRMIRDASPDTVRIMLTGFADVEASMAAVNEGAVFRFLTKPCPTETMVQALTAGLEQYRLVTAERELLRGTLRGSLAVLSEILSLVSPEAFGRGERVKRLMARLVKQLKLPDAWRYDLMAMLSQLGWVAIPEELMHKKLAGRELSPEESQIVGMRAVVGADLLANIPRMEEVREAIARQDDPASAHPAPPPGARLLRICQDYDDLDQRGLDQRAAFEALRGREGEYDPAYLTAFELVLFTEEGYTPRHLMVKDMLSGMVLGEPIVTEGGILLMAKGQELNELAKMRLAGLVQSHGLREPILVQIPVRAEKAAA